MNNPSRNRPEATVRRIPAPRRGMTLIELLVVITILTTLVAGVIPLLSPNNDERKIREASRELTSYISLAQAYAARTGRSHGVFLKKLSEDTGVPGDPTNPDRGVCLEVYQIEEPVSFTGFSDQSRVFINDNTGTLRAQFGVVVNGGFMPSNTELPAKMFRPGDIIEVAGNRYRFLKESDDPTDNSDLVNGFFITNNGPQDGSNPQGMGFRVAWLNDNGQIVSETSKSYKIRRLPMRSAEQPLQFPSGVCVDLQASGLPVTLIPSCCHNPLVATAQSLGELNNPMLTNNDDGIAVMFAPNGTVDQYLWNQGNVADTSTITRAQGNSSTSQVYFLVGRRENIPVPLNTVAEWTFSSLTSDEQDDRREQINWLNEESRWVVIGATTGRVLATNNVFLDLTNPLYSPPTSDLAGLMISVPNQIYDARQYAREMRREGGR